MSTPLIAVLLAAGEGTRMNSKVPKVLHSVAGRLMIDYILENARAAGAVKTLVIVPSKTGDVVVHIEKKAIPVVQGEKLGTGRALQQALPHLKSAKGNVLILYGDACLLRPQTVLALKQMHARQNSAATLLTSSAREPFGCGRVIRGVDGLIEKIVEKPDRAGEERGITEVQGGAVLFKAKALTEALQGLRARNAKGEYYLTDIVRFLLNRNEKVRSLMVPDASEILGINDRKRMAVAHRILNLRRLEELQRAGVTFLNPETVEIGPEVRIGRDSIIEGNVQIHGKTILGKECRVESESRLENVRLGRGVTVRSSRIWNSEIGEGSDVGPFAHVRGGCRIGPSVHIGTHAELKNASVGRGTSVGHFCYVGDARLGREVNVGAGCVFANYDGKLKHECGVGDKAFLGSNSTLVAPVNIGTRSVIGAGAVVTRDVYAGETVVGVPARPVRKGK